MPNIKQGPDSTPSEIHASVPGTSTDLSMLNLSTPEHLREANPVAHQHTADSVQKKWGERSMSTGLSIQGRRMRGAL